MPADSAKRAGTACHTHCCHRWLATAAAGGWGGLALALTWAGASVLAALVTTQPRCFCSLNSLPWLRLQVLAGIGSRRPAGASTAAAGPWTRALQVCIMKVAALADKDLARGRVFADSPDLGSAQPSTLPEWAFPN